MKVLQYVYSQWLWYSCSDVIKVDLISVAWDIYTINCAGEISKWVTLNYHYWCSCWLGIIQFFKITTEENHIVVNMYV